MRPAIDEVDELLARGVNVTIYQGQVSSNTTTSVVFKALLYELLVGPEMLAILP